MPMSFLKLNSLRSRLMLLVTLAVAPSVAMTIYTGWQERLHATQAAEESLQRLTNLAAINEAESLKSARQLLMDMSDIPDLMAGPARCNALLRAVIKKNPNYANLGLIQLNGDVTCSAVPSNVPVNLADRAHFKKAVAERRFVAGNYVFGRVIKKHTINLTYPVTDDEGRVLAVVFAALDLAALDKFISGINLGEGSILVTADKLGNIISRRPDPEKWFGQKITAELADAIARPERTPTVVTGPDGVARLHAFANVGTSDISDFTITIGVPTEEITAAARRDQMMALVTLALVMILALVATWFIGNFMIVRRVQALVKTAQKIAAGNLKARTGIAYGHEEISYLARALDEMAEALQNKEQERDRAEEELRAADRRKDEFLAMLAHELRNPLAPISNAARILKMSDTSVPHVRETSDIIARQVAHMTGLVDDLLDVSRVTRGLITLSREPVNLVSIAAAAIEQARTLIDTRKHHLATDLPQELAWTYGDRMRLIQIIANLLNNAAKYTPEGGQITLSIQSQDANWVINVRDNGVGISASLLPHIFELFSQADRTPDRSQGGLGLGLALVKSLVELHGGTVSVRSAGAGMGSEFTVSVPKLTGPAPEQEMQAGAPAPALPNTMLNLLVVDDNADAADTIALLLEDLGYRVSVEYDAHSALETARAESPHVLLLDVGLPDMDGYELARTLRAMPQTAASTLIALTGYGQDDDVERSRAAGFDHHFVKPADLVELAALLADISRRQQD
jgi:signal transduction histidine kinase/CheY-like chemotaxis protein